VDDVSVVGLLQPDRTFPLAVSLTVNLFNIIVQYKPVSLLTCTPQAVAGSCGRYSL